VTSTQLMLIRHGETAWNAEHRIQGHLDVPLSPSGIRQAARLAERLAGERVDVVYTSELSRARLTAEPLARLFGVEPLEDTRLRERCFGVFEGLTLDEISERHPEAFRSWRVRDPAWAMDQGESGQQLIDRVLDALHDICVRHAGATVAVVTHGGVLDVAYRAARALPWDAPREHQMLNASINRLRGTAHPLALDLVDWGDVTHLTASRDESLT
jgi:2,3-bisphosphoglycerate-dependent phosphoglycerate mutase